MGRVLLYVAAIVLWLLAFYVSSLLSLPEWAAWLVVGPLLAGAIWEFLRDSGEVDMRDPDIGDDGF